MQFGEDLLLDELLKFDYLSNEHSYLLPEKIYRRENADYQKIKDIR
jgi:hypothetical protein